MPSQLQEAQQLCFYTTHHVGHTDPIEWDEIHVHWDRAFAINCLVVMILNPMECRFDLLDERLKAELSPYLDVWFERLAVAKPTPAVV